MPSYVVVKTKSGFTDFRDPPAVAIPGPDHVLDHAPTHTTFTVFYHYYVFLIKLFEDTAS